MITGFAILRAVVYLKRISIALTSMEKHLSKLVELERSRMPEPARPPRHVELSVATVDDWNARYKREHAIPYLEDEEAEP